MGGCVASLIPSLVGSVTEQSLLQSAEVTDRRRLFDSCNGHRSVNPTKKRQSIEGKWRWIIKDGGEGSDRQRLGLILYDLGQLGLKDSIEYRD